jgi:hypothetical protein
VQTKPMKLFDCAMRTASLTDMLLWPLLVTADGEAKGASSAPRSLQRSTGSCTPLAAISSHAMDLTIRLLPIHRGTDVRVV